MAPILPMRQAYCDDTAVAGTFENRILYRMCFEHPDHTDVAVVKGKIIAIGRIYSASPQRGAGRPKAGNPDVFEAIAAAICADGFDDCLKNLPTDMRIDQSHIDGVVQVHARLKSIVFEATRINNERSAESKAGSDTPWKPRYHPSFASKYLHFHRPNLIPIYDGIAATGLAKTRKLKTNLRYQHTDKGYGRFCADWLGFAADFSKNQGAPHWSPRMIDTDLLKRGA